MDDSKFQERLRATFRLEAREHWQALTAGLLELERRPEAHDQQQVVETIFRETHTLKGAARLVGEQEVEAMSARLEEVFADLKERRRAPDPAALAELHALVATLQQLVGDPAARQAGTDTSPGETDPAPAGATVAEEVAATVRVPINRVDSLLRQAEELLALRTLGQERNERLLGLRGRLDEWHRRWSRLQPHVVRLRRELDQTAGQRPDRALAEMLGFLEWNEEVLGALRGQFMSAHKNAQHEIAWTGSVVDGLLEDAKEILVLPARSLLNAFPPFVRQVAQEQGKDIEVVLLGAEHEVDRRVLEELRDVLTHLVRNSLDHGIERPEEREAAGKPRRGTLTLEVLPRGGGNVEVTVSDDGRGVDLEQVRRTAAARGIASEAELEDWSEAELLGLLFESGFSTRREVTALSGRGLGLPIVKEKVDRLGGGVTIEHRPGHGATFRLVLPITLARFRGIFVQCGQQNFVLPATHVRQVVRVRAAQVRRIKNQPVLELAGEAVPVFPLHQILRLPTSASAAADGFAVVVSAGRLQVACRVDGIPFEQEIVMKPLGGLLPRVRHIAGATLVGAGLVVPVLNATDLVRAATERQVSTRVGGAPPAPPRRQRRILVAEDSITSRSLFKNILQGAGYEVRTAVDGVEAMTALQFETFDLVISDVQMPRLDGFELTRRIRADQKLATLPVILITSLASREDKEQGVDAGANAYVVKSSFDQSDLLQTLRRLIP
jgi:two-component system, chemotaxis family, sensor kinase CheA